MENRMQYRFKVQRPSTAAGRRLEPADVTADKTGVVMVESANEEVDPVAQVSDDAAGQGGASRIVIQSVDRALSILEVLADSAGEMRLQAIAAVVGLNSSTCYHLLSTLAARGYVARNPRLRTYYMGRRVPELNQKPGCHFDIVREAEPCLESLGEATGQSICMAAFSGTDLAILASRQARDGVDIVSYAAGLSRAAHATALGKAILAWLPEAQIARVVADNDLFRFGPKTIDTLGELVESLRQVRRHGFALEDEEFRAGVSSIACVVRDRAGGVIGAVGCLLPTAHADGSRLRSLQASVTSCAKAISAFKKY